MFPPFSLELLEFGAGKMRYTDGAIYPMLSAQTRDERMRLFDSGNFLNSLAAMDRRRRIIPTSIRL
jgi:hypothetical protein